MTVAVPGCPTRSTASLSSITPASASQMLPTVLIPAVTTELPTYECLCTYHVQTAVHSMPAKSSRVIGYIYERRCKPMYPIHSTYPEWRSIHYEKQVSELFEPRFEKTGFLHCENKDEDQLRSNYTAYQCLCFRYIDSTIPPPPKSEISSL